MSGHDAALRRLFAISLESFRNRRKPVIDESDGASSKGRLNATATVVATNNDVDLKIYSEVAAHRRATLGAKPNAGKGGYLPRNSSRGKGAREERRSIRRILRRTV